MLWFASLFTTWVSGWLSCGSHRRRIVHLVTQTPRPKELWHFTALVDVIDDGAQLSAGGGGVQIVLVLKVSVCILDLINVVKRNQDYFNLLTS